MAAVPRFEPFRGIRYAPGLDPAVVTSPPYDVIDGAERAALAASHPADTVHVDCPVGDLGSGRTRSRPAPPTRHGVGRRGPRPYAAAASTFEAWRADGALVTDDGPTFTSTGCPSPTRRAGLGATTGVLGALALDAPG